MSSFYILLFICINLFFYTESYNIFSWHKEKCNCTSATNSLYKTNTTNDTKAPSEIIIRYRVEEIENHLPSNMCMGASSLQNELTINNFANNKNQRTNHFFGILCLNCATCIAVAKVIDSYTTTAFEDYFDKYSDEEIDLRTEEQNLIHHCNTAFKNFDLRNYDGHILVSQSSLTTTHIKTPYDGQWTKKLRDTCKRFVSQMDLESILFQIKWGNFTFVNYLCSGDGIFRDCKNFHLYTEKIPKGKSFIYTQLVDCNSISGNSKC